MTATTLRLAAAPVRADDFRRTCLSLAGFPHIGVDVVSLSRIAKAGDREVRRFACGPSDLAAIDTAASHPDEILPLTAATWAVKEAAIKAAGGRPDGFAWSSIRVGHCGPSPTCVARLAGRALRNCTGSAISYGCHYEWSLAVPAPRGVAAWCVADGAVWAVAVEEQTCANGGLGTR
ncbi:MAG TPA: 4'-phosphopantetheinyl transferase superfamily protein [Streptosporangiaceae bacterium]|nr:4'-phosphopantetheinyl transferase superfamily protein [Streptosporangiaceae bacterium]